MPIDDANPLLSSLTALRNMLRDCFYWRALGGDTPWTQEQAEARIYYDELPAPEGADFTVADMNALRPLAMVWLDLNGGLSLRSESGGSCCWTPSGAAIVQIELPVPTELANNPEALAIDLHTKLGRIIRTADDTKPGLCDLAGIAGYLPLKNVLFRGYIRTDQKAAIEIGDAVRCELELQWGAE